MNTQLVEDFKRLKQRREVSIKCRCARVNLTSSVIRVFASGSKPRLFKHLVEIDLTQFVSLSSEHEFQHWYFGELDRLSTLIRSLNNGASRLGQGLKWGHAHKVLALYLADFLRIHRWNTLSQRDRVEKWLYCPVDSVVINRLRELKITPPAERINQITEKKFHEFQNLLQAAASKANVPRIWFDDHWGSRDLDSSTTDHED